MTAYDNFISKLDIFLQRFYMNRAWKGLFVLLAVGLSAFLVSCLIEYFSFLSGNVRKWFFWMFVVLFVTGFSIMVVYPFGQGRGWFKRMSHEQAARYLAACYPELDDKLYNVLDLKSRIEGNSSFSRLLEAAIEQTSTKFVSYRFEKVVKFKTNVKYILFFFMVSILFAVVYLTNPKVIGSSKRIVRYNQYFEREFPFSINVENKEWRVAYEEDFVLHLHVQGEILPDKIFIHTEDRVAECRKNSPNSFSYTFKKVQSQIRFRISSGKYKSRDYVIRVDYKPLISEMRVTLRYPSYMGKKPEVLSNSLNFSVPSGTKVDWEIRMDHAKELSVGFMEKNSAKDKDTSGFEKTAAQIPFFSFSKQIFRSCDYLFLPQAFGDVKTDTLSFSIECLPDLYPRIEAVQIFDSNRFYRRYFHGMISDDYGFHSLIFKLSCSNAEKGSDWTFSDTLETNPSESSQEFTYYFDIDAFHPQPGDVFDYGFEVRDNDAFHPFKAAYSSVFSYRKISEEEVREELGKTSASVNDKFSFSLKSVENFEKELDRLFQDLISRKQISWEDRQRVEWLLGQQEELRRNYQRLSKEIREKQRLENELLETDKELQEKQRQLQELMDKLFDDKTMRKLEELQELMRQNAPREKLTDVLEDVKRQKDALRSEIEHNLNLYKYLEFENKLRQSVGDAKKLLERSRDVSSRMRQVSNRKEYPSDSMLALQQDLEKERVRLQKDLEKLEDLNSDLEKSTSFSKPDSLLEKVRKNMKDTRSRLQENDRKSAEKTQGRTDESLEELVENLMSQMERIEEENEAEDADFLRILLKSTVRVSVSQENLMESLGKTYLNDPRYAVQIRKQSALNMEIRFLADSINAISRRQPQVALSTNQEVRNMLSYSQETLDLLLAMNNIHYQHYNTANSRALARQQYTMTSLNNLALLLSESLDRMQQKMNMKGKSGSSKKKQRGQPQMSCPKPGEKSASMPVPSMESMMKKQNKPSLQQMQNDLNRQLEELKRMLQQMQKEGKSQNTSSNKQTKSGESGNSQGGEVSDEKVSEAFARAAAKQEMIRRMFQEKMQKEKQNNPGSSGLYNQVLGDMERTERDLVNRILNDQVLSRQKNIESRLLEAENAELKRERDDKRDAKEGDVFDPFLGDSLEDHIKKKMPGNDLLRFSYPEMRPYYKKKVQDFLFDMEEK